MNYAIENLYAFLALGMEPVLLATVLALPVALLIFAIDVLFHRYLSPRVMCWLWLLVALRLMLPVAPPSAMSVQNLLRWAFPGAQSSSSSPEWDEIWQLEGSDLMKFVPASSAAQPSTAASKPKRAENALDGEDLLGTTIGLLWFITAGTLLGRALLASLRFSARLNGIAPLEDNSICEAVRSASRGLDIPREVIIKAVPDLSTPALFGIFSPTLCLPASEIDRLTQSEVRMIALHELMHLRRRDGLTAWLLTVVRAIHWFNPVSWLAIRRIEHYRELACDAAVRERTKPQDRNAYARLLMHFAAARPAGSLGLLGLWFAWPRRGLAARIHAFTTVDQPRFCLPHRAAIALLLLLVSVGLTDAARHPTLTEMETQPAFISPAPVDLKQYLAEHQAPQLPPQGKLESREYDLGPALAKIVETRPELEKPRKWLLTYTCIPGSSPTSVRVGDDPNHITLDATAAGHAYFAQLLEEVSRFGHTWQVVVSTRTFHTRDLELIKGIDWQAAVRYATSQPDREAVWAQAPEAAVPAGLTLSMETVSVDYAPYVATILTAEQMTQAIERLQGNPRSSILQSPKVTLFCGQVAKICDLAQRPFVVGVTHIRGELATAAQPHIAVLNEGMELGVHTSMAEEKTLNFRCELESSFIEGVSEAKMPGQDLVVQIPKAKRRTIQAQCQMKQGDTLLIAPLVPSTEAKNNDEGRCYAISAEWFADPLDSEEL